MANIILINDQDQEQTLPGVSKLVTRSTDGEAVFGAGVAQDEKVVKITANEEFVVCPDDGYSSMKKVTGLVDVPSDKSGEIDLIQRTIRGEYTSMADRVGAYAFSGCDYLTKITLPVAISMGAYAFEGLKSLTDISMPNMTGEITSLNYCSALVNADFPKATVLNGFYACTNLISLNIPEVTIIYQGSLFRCESLATLNAPKVITIRGQAIGNNNSLEEVILPSIETIGITNFRYCPKLKRVILGGSKVCSLSTNCFEGTPIVTSTTEGYIYVPSSLVASYKSAENWNAFSNKIRSIEEL